MTSQFNWRPQTQGAGELHELPFFGCTGIYAASLPVYTCLGQHVSVHPATLPFLLRGWDELTVRNGKLCRIFEWCAMARW